MGPVDAIKSCFGKYATFSGRSARSEYWWFFTFSILGIYAAIAVDSALLGLYSLGQPMKWVSIGGAFTLITLLPILSVGYRRLQDTGLLGWIYIALTVVAYSQVFAPSTTTNTIGLVAMIGTVVLCARNSQPGPNKYGPNPHEVPS